MHKIKLDISINLTSRWHAGAGEGSLTVDRNIRRDSFNKPYIPGSTLKGIIRESCERLSRTLGLGEPSDPHDSNIQDKNLFGPIELSTHPVDALFGNKYEGSDLFVRNAKLAFGNKIGTFELARTSISRARRTSRDGHLFNSEYAQPCIFRTSINGFHRNLVSELGVLPFAYSILIAGILNIDRIGSDKSTGCGAVEFKLEEIAYNDRIISPEEALTFLSDTELADYYELCREELEVS